MRAQTLLLASLSAWSLAAVCSGESAEARRALDDSARRDVKKVAAMLARRRTSPITPT